MMHFQDRGCFALYFLLIFMFRIKHRFPPKFHCNVLLNVPSGGFGKPTPCSFATLALSTDFPTSDHIVNIETMFQTWNSCKYYKIADQNHLSVKSLLSLANPALLTGL